MIPTIKPVTRDEFPFRRLLRSEKPARTLFTAIAAHTNENDLVSLQYRNTLLSVEDINILTIAQEESQGFYTPSTGDQVYPSLPYDDNQISFGFTEQLQTATAAEAAQPMGALISEDA